MKGYRWKYGKNAVCPIQKFSSQQPFRINQKKIPEFLKNEHFAIDGFPIASKGFTRNPSIG